LGICIDNDTNISLTPFCILFEISLNLVFQLKNKSIHRNKNGWITQGIKISCEHKWKLYICSRNSIGAIVKAFYIKYCKILNQVIQEAKKWHSNNRLTGKSDNKVKTTWNIQKQESGKIHVTEQMPSLLINSETN
jgi:hypothetical protein